jgi:hypothetical protein
MTAVLWQALIRPHVGADPAQPAGRRRYLGHFFEGALVLEGDLEPDPDVAGVPCVTGGPGDMPDGACTVFPPGAGSGTALRGAGEGAAGVAGANPLPEEPGASVAGLGDWALAYDGGRAARAKATTNRPARIMDRSTFPAPFLSTCMLAPPFPSGVDVSRRRPALPAAPAALRR